jgi:acetolactate synthase-1/2/3 large subunit
MSPRNALNGAQVIVDYLIRKSAAGVRPVRSRQYQFIDALYERSDELKTISVHHESVAGFMADATTAFRADRHLHILRAGSSNLPISLGNAFLTGAVHGRDRQRRPATQSRRVSGAVPALTDFPSTVRSY